MIHSPPHAWRRLADRPLPWLLLLAAILRIVAAFAPGFHHPDAIYQYLEPAHRLLTGDGAVTWEWRVGMRSWLLPLLLTGPMSLGEAMGPAGPWPVAMPRLAMGMASLSIVWSAWVLGNRRSRTAGLIAGFVAATWFECIYFGVQTLAEPIATAAFLPAAVLITADRPGRRAIALAGALLAFAVLMRPHYAPGVAALVLVAWWPIVRDPRAGLSRWNALIGGGLAVALVSGGIDIASGAMPFGWIVENVRQNIVAGVAARYGVSPPLTYPTWLFQTWLVWSVPIAIGLRSGWRASPALFAAAVVTLAVHSLIGHKEYRFVYLGIVAILILSAIGWADMLRHAARRWTVALCVASGAASLLLPLGPLAKAHQREGVPGSQVFALLRDDPATCGVALLYGASFADVPGTSGLRPHTPLALFWIEDPATGGDGPWQALARNRSGFNRIVGSVPGTGTVPRGYRMVMCEPATSVIGLCLYARPGPCSDTRASPFLLNRVLARRNF
jgi:hypothetical protein